MKKIIVFSFLFLQGHVIANSWLIFRSMVYIGSSYYGLKSVKTNDLKYLLTTTAIGSFFILERIFKINYIYKKINHLDDVFNKNLGVNRNLYDEKEALAYANHTLGHWVFFFGCKPDSLGEGKYKNHEVAALKNVKTDVIAKLNTCIKGTMAEAAIATILLGVPVGLYMKMPR